jgi:hypothetical protein
MACVFKKACEYQGKKCPKKCPWFIKVMAIVLLGIVIGSCGSSWAMDTSTYSDDEIANAIYLAEGGAKTSHPYGILKKYKVTTPRQACLNTIAHARRDWDGKGDFIEFLGNRYAPIGVANDPTNLNRNWVSNVKSLLRVG